MRNKKLFVISSALLAISVFLLSLFVYSQSFNYDNESPIFIADNRYSKEKIEKLEDNIPFSNMYIDYPFWAFNLEYKPKCIRKTLLGYYAVLINEDESLCFVFWTFDNKIYSIYRTKGFVSSDEFKSLIAIGDSTFKDMKKSSFDYFCYPYSKTIATAHICTDGILVIKYDDDFVVKSIDFFSNEELTKTKDDFINIVPYILPNDKIRNQNQSGDGEGK